MKPKLKSIEEQIVVITGASSGIGLTTAEMAAERGAKVVLAARSESDLAAAVARIRAKGGRATSVVADVANPADVESIAQHAVDSYGAIDTWVNDAGISVYGRLADVSLNDKRRVFDVTFWGVVHGCDAALPRLRQKGGVIVNIGSELSDMSAPLQGIYSAAKHAVKGYTNALRMELEEAGIPVWVSLIKPGPIDTPYTQHARNYLPNEPAHPKPTYAPEEVARAILKCAERPIREVVVGGVPRLQLALHAMAPRLSELYAERALVSQQQSDRPATSGDSLYRPSGEDYGRRRSRHGNGVRNTSLYTRAVLSDAMRAAPLIAIGAAVAASVAAARR
jgi:short-subunit dehydrogenase